MNNPNIVNYNFVPLWLSLGADVELDIIPAIRETTRRQQLESPDWNASTLKYFDGPVKEWRRHRTSPGRRPAPARPPLFDVKAAIARGIAEADAKLEAQRKEDEERG